MHTHLMWGGGLYLVRADELRMTRCKIGISRHFAGRLDLLAAGSPVRLRMVAVWQMPLPRARLIETAALRLLEPVRHHGEWVSCNTTMARKAIERAIAHFENCEDVYRGSLRWIHKDWVSVEREFLAEHGCSPARMRRHGAMLEAVAP